MLLELFDDAVQVVNHVSGRLLYPVAPIDLPLAGALRPRALETRPQIAIFLAAVLRQPAKDILCFKELAGAH